MAESDGVLGDGTQLHLTNNSAALTKILGLMSVNRPNIGIAKVESTDQDSYKTKEYIPGHGDWPELKAKIKYEPGSPTDTLINEHLLSRQKRPFKIVTVSEDGTTEDNTGSLFLMSYEPDDAPLGGIRTATISGQPGPISQAATA
jgi:hypothetical protein